MSAPSIAVVAFDHISPFHLSVPCVVFGDKHPGLPTFNFKVCTEKPGSVTTTAGFSLHVRHDLRTLRKADTIIVPSWRDPAERPPEILLAELAKAQKRGAQVVGLCLGAYVLAEAELLDERSATTHWAYAQDFAARYPQIRVDADVLYVEDGNLMTSAGTAAGIDCCLHIIRERYGAEPANSLARRLVVPPHRQGGQAQYIEQPVPTTNKSLRLSELIEWTRAHLDKPHSLDSLARQMAMSRRTLTRQFRQLTGMTIGEWLNTERLALAQRLLETSDHSIDAVAMLTGFGSPESLRLHFRRAFGVAPTTWRQSFRGKK